MIILLALLATFGVPAFVFTLIHDHDVLEYGFNVGEKTWLPITEAKKKHNREAELHGRKRQALSQMREIQRLIEEADRLEWPTDVLKMKLTTLQSEIDSIEKTFLQRQMDELSGRYQKAIEG